MSWVWASWTGSSTPPEGLTWTIGWNGDISVRVEVDNNGKLIDTTYANYLQLPELLPIIPAGGGSSGSSGSSSGSGRIEWVDYTGGKNSNGSKILVLGPLNPGDKPSYTGAFSPGPPQPGTSVPVFDPPIRTPEARSGILFPLDKCWLLDTHEGQDEEIYARTDMDMGPARLRRKYTQVPHVRKAKIFLTFEESKIFHEWFEQTLGVGQLRWIGQFHDIGFGIRWFEAEFNKPWEAEYVALGVKNEDGNAARAWKISIEVRLYGDGELHNPLLDPNATADFKAAIKLPLVTEVSLKVVNFLTARFSLPLTSSYSDVTLGADFKAPLVGIMRTANTLLQANMFTYLSSSAYMRGWERFEAKFSA